MTRSEAIHADDLIEGVRRGEKKSVAQLFNLLEDRRPQQTALASAWLDDLYRGSLSKSHVIGITGPPGAGKSCLVSRLIRLIRDSGRSVGVLAIDPSSRATGGALLGDRIRFDYDVSDTGIFVRSMANRGETGGVSDRAFAGIVVLRSAFDVVLVETVGIGQAEADVASLADTTILVIQPGSGDVLQFLKAGIMEEPHIFAVNKSDMGAPARRAANDVRSAVEQNANSGPAWNPPVILCSAQKNEGIEELLSETKRHGDQINNGKRLNASRRSQAATWIWQSLIKLYGQRGVMTLGGANEIEKLLDSDTARGPFKLFEELAQRLESRIISPSL